MSKVLITGANRGIGLGLTKTYLANGYDVHATYRDSAHAKELLDLARHNHRLQCYGLDVTDYPAVNKLASQFSSLDIFISNAGYYGAKGNGLGHTDVDDWRYTFEVNTIAPLKWVESFYQVLKQGKEKKIACLSSKMGSINDNQTGGAYEYRSSKAALNAVVKSLSIDCEPWGISVIAIHPGWVKTTMGGAQAQIDPLTSAHGIFDVIDKTNLKKSGQFFNYDGSRLVW